MLKEIRPHSLLRGEITPPGDKSITHRAILFNSIAQGKSKLTNLSPGADCLSTLTCMKALGVRIKRNSATDIEIDGAGQKGLREAEDALDAGNSGTTMRLLAGLLAAQPFLSVITGDRSLRSRPMGRILTPLQKMGAQIWGRGDNSLAPLAIKGGKLQGIDYTSPVASAQLKSAILIAALFAEGETTVREPSASRDHTELMLQAMGVNLERNANRITLTPPSTSLKSLGIYIPGDISSAAYWLVLGAVHPDAEIKLSGVGINPTRTGIIDILQKMGAKISIKNECRAGGEPVADIIVQSGELSGIQIEGDIIPRLIDEIPVIAVAACAAKGTTVIKDAAELRIKETDRISTTVSELSKLGAKVEELPDGIAVHGGFKLRGTECSSHKDHRLAMALGVAGLIAEGNTTILDADSADISYPSFWQDMEKIIKG